MEGTVFKVDQKGAYVDVGGKTTAFCAKEELSLAPIDRVRAAGGWRGFANIGGAGQGAGQCTCKQWGAGHRAAAQGARAAARRGAAGGCRGVSGNVEGR